MTRTRTAIAALASAALAFAAPAGAGASVQVGSSAWQWGNPLPQGNTLRSMSFAGAAGYAAGDFGTLLRTDDGGVTWAGLPAGTFTNLTRVQAVDTDTVIAGGGCVMRRTDDGGKTFQRIPISPVESTCAESLAAFSYPNEKVGYVALADGTVNQNAGAVDEFASRTAVPGTHAAQGQATPTDLLFRDEANGFAATTDGKIYETTDGANSWKVVNDTNRAVRAISFTDAKTGYAVGDGSLFLKTSDGGETWKAKDLAAPAPADLTSIRCAATELCVASTKRGDMLVRTADGGGSFTFASPSTDPLLAAAFSSPTHVVAVGEVGATVVSDDAGVTFSPVGSRLAGSFSRIVAGQIAGAAFAPGHNGALARTVDGGRTWTRGNVPTSEDVRDVSFPARDSGYALDTQGGLFLTSDGGAHWKTLDTGTTARPSALLATGAKTILVVGPTGVRRSTDEGGSFDAVSGPAVARTPLSGVDRAGGAIVAYGPHDLIESLDGGAHWKTLRKPGPYRKVRIGRTLKLFNGLPLRLVDFVDAKTGFLVDGTGRLWRTRNAGSTWTELPGTGTQTAYGMAFSNAKQGYLVIDRFGDLGQRSGFLLRTTDGGTTWHPQFVVSTPIAANGVSAGLGGADYLLGGSNDLLATTTGGDRGQASTLTITTKKTRLTKPTRITVTGKLTTASHGGAPRVTVSYRGPGQSRWQHQTVAAAANGSFTTSWNVPKGTSLFVGQWQGDFAGPGDGSPVLQVRVAGKGAR
jgi:photosystem II stability/assembly factor-like uncharacterized protein